MISWVVRGKWINGVVSFFMLLVDDVFSDEVMCDDWNVVKGVEVIWDGCDVEINCGVMLLFLFDVVLFRMIVCEML